MRTVDDICLLCRINRSTKSNSHILPRFISTDFLGPQGVPKRGFEISSDNDDLGGSRVVQDSPKEDYILCAECEAYLGILEAMTAATFKFWREKVESGEFSEHRIEEFLSVVTCTSADPLVMRLLVYSMFWRASISSHSMFENYQLSPQLQDSLRTALMSFRSLTHAELREKIATINVVLHPYAAVTARTFQDDTANVVAALNWGNPASLHVDRFGFLLFEDRERLRDPFFLNFSNIKTQDRTIMVFSEGLWHELMVQRTAEVYARNHTARRMASGQ